jgi:ubiquinone biosynthesis accessory factor UbiJ
MISEFPAIERLAQRAIDRVVRLDPDARRRFGELYGKTVLIEIAAQGEPLRIYVSPTADGISVHREHDGMPDVAISGTLSTFLRQWHRGPGVSDALTIRGDIELGQRFQRALSAFDPDWEEGIAGALGDVPAHQVTRFARAVRTWVRRAVATLGQDGAEYLKEEALILAKRERVVDFLRAVDELRADADRLEQRLQRLAQSL